MIFIPGYYTLQDVENFPVLPGFDRGELWNGYQCPTFSRANVIRIFKALDMGYEFQPVSQSYIWTNDAKREALLTRFLSCAGVYTCAPIHWARGLGSG